MNFANVLSGIARRSVWLVLPAILALSGTATASSPRVVIAVADGPLDRKGAMSAGLGRVPAAQTYLDISQGTRVWRRLYDPRELPELELSAERIRGWGEAARRARSAPADIVPGLLAVTLRRAGRSIAVRDPERVGLAATIAADRHGRFSTDWRDADVVVQAGAPEPRPGMILIAFERPPPTEGALLDLTVFGGRPGVVSSDSTRLDGLVLSTDIAPTVLGELGVPVPDEMEGSRIRGKGGGFDLGQPLERLDRLGDIGDRRGTVLGAVAAAWALLLLVAVLFRRRIGALPMRAIALAPVLLPAALLLTAVPVRISEQTEVLVAALAPLAVGLGLTRLLPPWRSYAAAAAISVGLLAADLAAGSFLTARSLLGPNPALGARFYGIGNELEAVLCVLVPLGIAAALTGLAIGRRPAALCLGGGCLAAGLYLGLGRFGADVGAVIALGAAAATGVLVLLRARPRTAVAILLTAPLVGLALLVLGDLLAGGDAHLTRSVLDAGGLDGLADVAERRLRLSAASFGRTANLMGLAALVPLVTWAALRRGDISAALGTPELRAGFSAAAAAVLIGTLANDSGALVLLIGSLFLALALLYARNQTGAAG